MGDFSKVLFILFALFLVYRLYTNIKDNPKLLSRVNISKSFSTMGMIALALISFITFLVFILRAA